MFVFHCCFNWCFRPRFRYPSGCFRNAGVLQMSVLKNAICCIPPPPRPAWGRLPFRHPSLPSRTGGPGRRRHLWEPYGTLTGRLRDHWEITS